ncbi:MAG: class I SAM-dependent methyltransferase [Methylohalobius sp.]|nr:class I SAM-dependent methyltransferase [Methylohalobius sp.]
MRFFAEVLPYLRGESFSDNLRIPFFEEREPLLPWWIGRAAYLEKVLAGRSVIHVGCVDHGPENAAARMAKDAWLHQKLARIASTCAGVDIDAQGIKYLAETLGLSQVYCADLAAEDVPALQNRHWDVLLLGEVIEHLDDPVAFLTGVRRRYGGCIGSLLATVPNAFAWDNLRYALRGEERINTDHRYWFTPYTLAKVLIRAGFTPKAFHFMSLLPVRRPPIWKSFYRRRKAEKLIAFWMQDRYPALRKTLVMWAVPQ